VGPLLNEVGALVMDDAEKVGLLNAFFASVFSAKAGPQESQALEVREKAYRRKDHDQGGSGARKFKQTRHPQIHGPRWNTPTSAEGAGRCHC